MSDTLTVINEEWVLPNANFKYVKSSGIVNLIEDFALESKNYKKSNPTADVYVQFYYTAGKGQIIEFTDTFNFSDNFSIDKLYAYGNVLKLKFKDINTKTTGNLDFVVTITVKNRTGAETFETIETININEKLFDVVFRQRLHHGQPDQSFLSKSGGRHHQCI